jgi:hypothetical protein
LSRGFWRSEPTEYHNFDSVKAINDHEDDPSQSDIDAEEPDSTDEELIEENDLLEEEQWLTSHSCLCPLCNYVVG